MVLRVTFHVGGVGRGPVSRIADVAEQMECGAAERVAAFVRTRPGKAGHYVAGPAKAGHYTPGNLHARLLVRVARAFRDLRIARRERQAATIEDSPARDRREHVGQTFVVLVTAHAIGLYAHMRSCDERIGTDHLHIKQRDQDDDCCSAESNHDAPDTFAKWFGDRHVQTDVPYVRTDVSHD